jgi:ferredoxin
MGSYGKSKRTYALMGLDRVADTLGAQLVNMEDLGLIEIQSPTGKILLRFKATSLLDHIDGIVNLPKLKTHILTGLTGAVKNLLGLLPGSLKRAVHVDAPSGSAMAQALVDILGGVKRKVPLIVNLMDGIIAMEGAGPNHGRLKETGWLLTSLDPVALDYVAASIMGFIPSKIRTITAAVQAGLGNGDPTRIELRGAGWKELPFPGFQHPLTRPREWIERIVPNVLIGRAIDWVYESKPRVRTELCQRCNLCIQACPAQAMIMTEEGLRLEKNSCIECYCCLEHCPHEGLWVPRGILDRIRGRRK